MILFGTEITWDPKHQKSFEKGGNKNVYVNKDILHVSNFDSILVPRVTTSFHEWIHLVFH